MSDEADALYKQLFSHPEMVRELLADFFPYSWTRELDVQVLERVNASYVSDRGRKRQGDMVWRLKVGGHWVYVYILLEFQRRPDKWMALRMQTYVGLLCQDLIKQHRLSRNGKLPPVLPIVLYHGQRAWKARTSLADLMWPAPEGLKHLQPEQQYVLVDREHPRTGASGAQGNLVAALFNLMESRTSAAVAEVLNTFIERMQEPQMASMRESVTRWVLMTLQGHFPQTTMKPDGHLREVKMRLSRKFNTIEEFMAYELTAEFAEDSRREGYHDGLRKGREEGRLEGRQAGIKDGRQVGVKEGRQVGVKEGRQVGIKEGREEGRKQGQKDALKDILMKAVKRAMDQVPAEIALRLRHADYQQLNEWVAALLAGHDIEQVFRLQ